MQVFGVATAINDGRGLFVHRDPPGTAQVFKLDVLKLDAEVFADDLAAGKDRNVFEHGLATITEARCFHRGHGNGAAQLVDHEGRQSFAFNIFRDNQHWLAQLCRLFKNRQHVSQ